MYTAANGAFSPRDTPKSEQGEAISKHLSLPKSGKNRKGAQQATTPHVRHERVDSPETSHSFCAIRVFAQPSARASRTHVGSNKSKM